MSVSLTGLEMALGRVALCLLNCCNPALSQIPDTYWYNECLVMNTWMNKESNHDGIDTCFLYVLFQCSVYIRPSARVGAGEVDWTSLPCPPPAAGGWSRISSSLSPIWKSGGWTIPNTLNLRMFGSNDNLHETNRIYPAMWNYQWTASDHQNWRHMIQPNMKQMRLELFEAGIPPLQCFPILTALTFTESLCESLWMKWCPRPKIPSLIPSACVGLLGTETHGPGTSEGKSPSAKADPGTCHIWES